MFESGKLILVASILFVLSSAMPASAEILTVIDFDTVPANLQCGQVWQEDGADLWLTDYASSPDCYFGADPESGEIWLYPAKLVIDLGISMVVHRVEIDIYDNCGQGCTEGFLLNLGADVVNQGNSISWGPSTLTLIPTGELVDSIAIRSLEGSVQTVRIYTDIVDNTVDAWSEIKSTYK